MLVHRLENGIATAVFAAMALLALLEVAGRALLGAGVPGSIVLVQHLTLWVALVGAGLAARSNSLLALSTPQFFPERFRPSIELFPLTVATAITASLCLGSLDVVRIERGVGDTVAWGIPSWIVIAVLPAGFAIITARLIWRPPAWRGRLLVALGLLVPAAFAAMGVPRQDVVLAAFVAIIAATALGMPVVATIGGTALLFFWADGTPLNAVAGEDVPSHDLPDAAGDPVVRPRRLHSRRGPGERADDAVVQRSVRLDAGRPRHRHYAGARVLHAAHRRVRRDDPVDGRPAASGARGRPLRGAHVDRPRHRLGIDRAAVFSQPSGIPLCVLRQRSVRTHLHRRAPSRHAARHGGRRLGRGAWLAERRGLLAVRGPAGGRVGLGSQVGTAAAGRRARRDRHRADDPGRGRGAWRALRRVRRVRGPSRARLDPRRASGDRRMRDAGRRLHGRPRDGVWPDELSRHRRRARRASSSRCTRTSSLEPCFSSRSMCSSSRSGR